MSPLAPTPLALFTSLPGTGKTTQRNLKHLRHRPALARNIVGKACARPSALEAMEARP